MANAAKKKLKLQERLADLEKELAMVLQKKSHAGQVGGAHADVDVPARMRQISDLRVQISKM